jgi:predicted nucleotidyltransferase
VSTVADAVIDPVMHGRIRDELAAIEREHGVEILLAVESGSRAWGFPSRDSDYDVRFIYLRPVEDYLTVETKRDVIERPIDSTLDVNGWDLRKALQLLVRSNAVLLEWLTSPVRYRDGTTVSRCLLHLARTTADLSALAYHYDRLARRSFDEIATRDEARVKGYCYAVRPTLALLWLRNHIEPPPMDLRSLIVGTDLSDQVSNVIADLVARKAVSAEQDVISRIPVLDEFIRRVLLPKVMPANFSERSAVTARADALFASIVLGRLAAAKCEPAT